MVVIIYHLMIPIYAQVFNQMHWYVTDNIRVYGYVIKLRSGYIVELLSLQIRHTAESRGGI